MGFLRKFSATRCTGDRMKGNNICGTILRCVSSGKVECCQKCCTNIVSNLWFFPTSWNKCDIRQQLVYRMLKSSKFLLTCTFKYQTLMINIRDFTCGMEFHFCNRLARIAFSAIVDVVLLPAALSVTASFSYMTPGNNSDLFSCWYPREQTDLKWS